MKAFVIAALLCVATPSLAQEYSNFETCECTDCYFECCEEPLLPTMLGRGGLLQPRLLADAFLTVSANHASTPAENNSARAQDRIGYQFNFLNDVPVGDRFDPSTVQLTTNRYDNLQEHRFFFEKQCLIEGLSLDLIVPVYHSTSRQYSDVVTTVGPMGMDTQLGDLAFGFKQEIIHDATHTLSIGLRVEAPTRDELTDSDGDTLLHDEVWHFMPYVACEYQCGDWYYQGWLTYRMNNDNLVNSSGTGTTREPEYLFVDLAVGREMYQCAGSRWFLSTELHYLQSTTAEVFRDATGSEPSLTAAFYGRTDVLDATLALTGIFDNEFSISAGLALPLQDSRRYQGARSFNTDRSFDVAFLLNTNFYY